jgi:hypothetical protein
MRGESPSPPPCQRFLSTFPQVNAMTARLWADIRWAAEFRWLADNDRGDTAFSLSSMVGH